MNIIKAHPAVRMLNEPLGNHVSVFRKLDLHPAGRLFEYEFASSQESEYFHLYIESLNSWLQSNESVSGIKEVLFLNKIEWLQTVFPKSKIIVLLRDPRGVVEALVRRNLDIRWEFSELLRDYYKENSVSRRLPASRHEIAAEIWKIRMDGLLKTTNLRNVHFISAENMVENFEQEIQLLMSVIGLPVSVKQVDFAHDCWLNERGGLFSNYHDKSRIYAWKDKLSKKTESDILRIVSTSMERISILQENQGRS